MISRKSALVFINNVLGALIGYIAMFFIIRYLGKETLGIVAFAISFVGLFSFISNLGFDNTHVKQVSGGEDVGRCNGTYLLIKLLLTGLMIGTVLTSIFIWKDILGHGFETKTHENAIYLALIYWTFFSLMYIFISTFNGRREIARSQTIIFANNFVRSTLIIVFSFLSLGVLAIMNAYIAGVFIAFLLGLWMFRKLPISMPDREHIMKYVRFAIPLSISSSAIIIASNTDVVMIQWFWNALDVADYYAAKRIGMILTMFSISISTVLMPSLSHMDSKGDRENIRRTTMKAERYISMITFPLVFFILVFPEKIITVFLASSMRSAAHTMQVLTLFYALIVLNSPYNSQLMALGRSGILGKVGIMRAIINIALNLIFIPVSFMGFRLLGLGAFGAALATLITFLLTTANIRWATYRLTGTVMDRRILLHISAAMLTSMLFFVVDTSWAVRWYSLGILGLAFLATYFGILYLLREFRKEEFMTFTEALHPTKMLRYMGEELRRK